MFSKFGQIIGNMINIKSLPISISIVLVSASIRYFYKKNKFIKGIIHQISTTTSDNSKDNVGTHKYWILFFYYFIIISLNGILGSIGIGDLFGYCKTNYLNPETHRLLPQISPVLFIAPAVLFAFYKSFKHKGIRALTDLAEPELPLAIRIFMFPIELFMLLIKMCILPFRLGMHAYISHEIIHSLLRVMTNQVNEGDPKSIMIGFILVLIKLMEIMSGFIQALIFTINMSILFGKLYKEEH